MIGVIPQTLYCTNAESCCREPWPLCSREVELPEECMVLTHKVLVQYNKSPGRRIDFICTGAGVLIYWIWIARSKTIRTESTPYSGTIKVHRYGTHFYKGPVDRPFDDAWTALSFRSESVYCRHLPHEASPHRNSWELHLWWWDRPMGIDWVCIGPIGAVQRCIIALQLQYCTVSNRQAGLQP